jgi:hypothetical protein
MNLQIRNFASPSLGISFDFDRGSTKYENYELMMVNCFLVHKPNKRESTSLKFEFVAIFL